jgi:hypothetical protein
MAPVSTVPAEAITSQGRTPLRRSSSSACSSASIDMRYLSSVAMTRLGERPRPAMWSALSTQ